MKQSKSIITIAATIIFITIMACDGENVVSNWKKKFNIKNWFSKLKKENTITKADTANLFDSEDYDPAKVDSNTFMKEIANALKEDSAQIEANTNMKEVLATPADSLIRDTIAVKQDSFTNDIKKVQKTEVASLKFNLDQLKEKVVNAEPIDSTATQSKCKVWADVSKKDQRLYLYVDGACVDTFKVSTGDKKHETPLINRRPSGPTFSKYTSKKYPGGNWNGLGNMPYVVFIQGGYGIHGTTIGNIKRLGTKASHGCVRVHPDNAKIFFELVRAAGIENTWVTIRE